jgi:hypothetical protein
VAIPTHDFPVVDLDSHLYEPQAIWDLHVPAYYRALARSALSHATDRRGDHLTILNGRRARELNRSKINRQAV